MPELPIIRRFPALGPLARHSFGSYPTPVERVTLSDGRVLLLKRDDLTAPLVGGNKVRGLEWLLGDVRPGDCVLTVGPRGSTHALATAMYVHQLGARCLVVRWDQEMNAAASRVDARLRSLAAVRDVRWVAAAYAVVSTLRIARRVDRWVPAGGATPLALLGYVNAALELASQIEGGDIEAPRDVVVPFGTGGTAAGLSLGFRIAGLRARVVAVRVVPRVLGTRRRILRLANATATLMERTTGTAIPRVDATDVVVTHEFYAGRYGRPLPGAPSDAPLRAVGVELDDTYSRKAFTAALSVGRQPALLWLTFDSRLLQD